MSLSYILRPTASTNGVSLITSAENNYRNTLQFFHFHASIDFPKRMGRQLLRLALQNKISKGILVVEFSKCVRGTGHSKKYNTRASG